MWFIQLDKPWNARCDILDDKTPLDKLDIVKCVNSEILDPFIWLFFPLGVAFLICGFLEKKKPES